MSLEILFDHEQRAFAPGQTIAGRMRWRLETIPEWVEIRLFWYTEGKGSQDMRVVETLRFNEQSVSGERPFSFVAPAYPPSCSGKLVSIRWALEFVCNVQEIVPCVQLIIAPKTEVIVLGSAD